MVVVDLPILKGKATRQTIWVLGGSIGSIGARPSALVSSLQIILGHVNVKPMQYEATTRELSEILSVTEKTICEWAKHGIMTKLRHGKYDLKNSLENWAAYQKCIFEGYDDPLAIWQITRDIAWSEAHPQRFDLEDLRDISELADDQSLG